MTNLVKVFEPGRIGEMELPNRLVKPAEVAYSADVEGYVTDTLTGYNAERAKGGIGLVTTGITSFLRDQPLGRFFPAIFDDSYIPGHKKQVDAIHQYGAKASIQIAHHGGSIARRLDQLSEFKVDVMAPSAMVFPAATVPARAMTKADISRVIEGFAEAAFRGKRAGYDAVEIHSCGMGLVNQFRSPYFNKRTDEYGGTREKRARFACELFSAIRKKIGRDMALIAKISGSDQFEGGLTPEDCVFDAPLLAEAGLDAMLVGGGVYMMSPNGVLGMCYLEPAGSLVPLAAAIKRVVKIPVIAGGRIGITLAESVLRAGDADFIAIMRPVLADPHMPNKAKEGRMADIRHCVYCGDCQWADFADYRESLNGRGMACSANPCVGSEVDPAFAIRPASKAKQVVVVGGGIAGMEAARVLAERGHKVTLYEKDRHLGGQWRTASRLKERRQYLNTINSLKRGLRQAKVSLVLGQEMDTASITAIQPDAVVIATGPGRAALPVINDVAGTNVVHAQDVLLGKAKFGSKVVVVGPENPSMEVAYWFVGKCKRVSLVLLPDEGRRLNRTWYYGLRSRLTDLGVYIYPNASVMDIQDNGIRIKVNNEPLYLTADTIVQANLGKSDTFLYEKLKTIVPEVYAVGDCVEPRHAAAAIRGGAEIGRLI